MGHMPERCGALVGAIALALCALQPPAAASASLETLAAASAFLVTAKPSGAGRVESAKLYGNINKYAYYFTELEVGSPKPQRVSVIVDTGSRLLAFPCSRCPHCGPHLDAAFDVDASRSARWEPCGDQCTGTCLQGKCSYSATYSEGSSIKGSWFSDDVRLGEDDRSNAAVTTRMGCHTYENNLFYTQLANGIMGLAPRDAVAGTAPTILQNLFQDSKHVGAEVFSMCLATWGGQLTLGGYNTSYHEASGIQWTPMRPSHYYFAFPEAMDLGDPGPTVEVVKYNSEFGVTIIDSGTTFTYLPSTVFLSLNEKLDQRCANGACGGAERCTVDSCCSGGRCADKYCWRLNGAGPGGFPVISMRFRGGTSIDWSPDAYLHERGLPGVWCQTFMENNVFQTVLGISWMVHKDVIFDIGGKRLGVARARCPQHHRDSDYGGIIQKAEVIMAPRSINALVSSPSQVAALSWARMGFFALVGMCVVVLFAGGLLRWRCWTRASRASVMPDAGVLASQLVEASAPAQE